MEPVTLDTFRRNAYRILGLQGTATQEQIDFSARLLRLHSEGDAPPTFNDAAWLGPIVRTPPEVDNAVMRLTDPESRTIERLWWFCNVPPASDAGLMPPAQQTGELKLRHRHDEMISALCRLLIVGAGGEALEKWRALLSEFRALSRSDSYLQWLLEIESAGNFEKPASADEIAALQGQMAGQAATALINLADDYVEEQSFIPAGRIVGMLRDASGGQEGPARDSADRIVNRLDDMLVGECNECIAQIDAAWKTKQIRVLKPACSRAAHRCQGTIEDLRREILKWCADDPGRADRVSGEVLKVYTHIADAYEACHDKYSARQSLMKSAEIAQGTAMEPRLRERIAALTGARPVKEESSGGGAWDFFSGGGRWGVIALVIVLVNAVRICSHTPGSSGSSRISLNDPALAQSKAMIEHPESRQLMSWALDKAEYPGKPTAMNIIEAMRQDNGRKPGEGKLHELYLKAAAARAAAGLPVPAAPPMTPENP